MSRLGRAPIIVVKKVKKVQHGHHGGSWKVAYADFVTAMMALFIVLWIVGQDQKIKAAIQEYFKDPNLTPQEIAKKVYDMSFELPGQPPILTEEDTPKPDPLANADEEELQKLAERLRKALAELKWVKSLKGQILVRITDEGLLIELLDLTKSPLFGLGSPDPKVHAREAILAIGKTLASVDRPLFIEGHTDSRPFIRGGEYGNWELSADRANAARRLLVRAGVRAQRVAGVRGFADVRPRDPGNPISDTNRRVTILVPYRDWESPYGSASGSPSRPARRPASGGVPLPNEILRDLEPSPGASAP